MAPPADFPSKLPPLRALQAFEAVARCGSVTDAARDLGVSPGAVSQHLRKLEEQLGLRLVERRGKGVELTAWGRTYQAGLEPAFEQLHAAQSALWRARTQSGLLVSTLSSVANRWLGPQLFDWQAAHPGTKVRLVGTESEPNLVDDAVDFRLSYGAAVRRFDQHALLFTDAAVPVCAPSLLDSRALVEPADLLELPRIDIEWDARHGAPPRWVDWAASIGAQGRGTAGELAFSQSSAAIDAAVHGRGIVLGQIALIGDDLAAGRLVAPFDRRLPLAQPYFLAWDRATLGKPFGAPMRDWIVSISRRQERLSAGPLPRCPAQGAKAAARGAAAMVRKRSARPAR